jgi:hypothetical protein
MLKQTKKKKKKQTDKQTKKKQRKKEKKKENERRLAFKSPKKVICGTRDAALQ